MRIKKTISYKLTRLLMLLLACVISHVVFAQDPTDSIPPDPGSISVYTVQNMSFGAFLTGASGGTITVASTGTRSSTGTVVPLNLGVSYFQAIFEVDAPQGTIISVLNGPNATLTGSNGGSMTLAIGNADPSSPFTTTVAQPLRTQVNIGGTLTVGNAASSPPGTYTGSFSITFNNE